MGSLWDTSIGDVKNPTFSGATTFTGNPVFSGTPSFTGTPTFSGLAIDGGGLIDAGSGIVGKTDFIQRLSLPVTAIANTDYTMSVPTGATILSAVVYTTTAYTAVTDAKIQIGSAAAGAQYVAATSIAAIGIVNLTLVAAAAASLLSMPAGTPNVFIRIVQSGGSTAVGAGMLVINYTQA